jgi:hypothetical protein
MGLGAAAIVRGPAVKRLLERPISRALLGAGLALAALRADPAHAEAFRTRDPLKAFIEKEYPLGDDYFIHGANDTVVFRCLLEQKKDGLDGIALSEISIWGNRSGPWEIFREDLDGNFVYVATRARAASHCLESCRMSEYLASRRCKWLRGWPK